MTVRTSSDDGRRSTLGPVVVGGTDLEVFAVSGASNVLAHVNRTPPGAPYVFSAHSSYGIYITSANSTSGGSGLASTPPCTLGGTFNVPPAACGKTVQAVDVASRTATNPVVLQLSRCLILRLGGLVPPRRLRRKSACARGLVR